MILRRTLVDQFRIDKRFVTQLPSDHADVALVSSTIDLAHRLGLEIVAEGVESGDALCWLRNNAVDQVQWFYWSEPLSSSFELTQTFNPD